MSQMELALHSWVQEKIKYEKAIRNVTADLTVPIKFIPSPLFDSKLEELKQYLRYSYTYEEDEAFLQIYVHSIAGVINLSLMELANRLVNDIGGQVKFWQNKIVEIAVYVAYLPGLSIWEVNRAYQKYMGLSPEVTQNLRKKKSLAKYYITALININKSIQKAKPFKEDLLKIDDLFIKLKKTQEKYYAFLEETENKKLTMTQQSNISQKGKEIAKNSLFMFLKPKQEKLNTLTNYNFKSNRQILQKPTTLLKGQKYQQFDHFIRNMRKQFRASQKNGYCDEDSQSRVFSDFDSKRDEKIIPAISSLRQQFKINEIKQKKQQQTETSQKHITFIWSKQYFFSYWGYSISIPQKIQYTQPFKQYSFVNYQIDSEQEYDQLNAEDVDSNEDDSSQESLSNDNSFVVSDDYVSDDEEQKQSKQMLGKQFYGLREIWDKKGEQMEEYTIICLTNQNLPLSLSQNVQLLNDEKLMENINGKGKSDILTIIEQQRKRVSKTQIDTLLRNNFKKIRTKDKKTIYVREGEDPSKWKVSEKISAPTEINSESESTNNQNYQITISYATRSKQSRNLQNQVILEESQNSRETTL